MSLLKLHNLSSLLINLSLFLTNAKSPFIWLLSNLNFALVYLFIVLCLSIWSGDIFNIAA